MHLANDELDPGYVAKTQAVFGHGLANEVRKSSFPITDIRGSRSSRLGTPATAAALPAVRVTK